uniref:Uncharacterized protein n=1 Tax=Timema monikensis TaxID=170555 RepID=A0A7R9EF99_9NEOP|nr:unnamed protein product [Timema monikensis]
MGQSRPFVFYRTTFTATADTATPRLVISSGTSQGGLLKIKLPKRDYTVCMVTSSRDDPIGTTERESVPITAPELEYGGGIYSFNNVVYTSPYYIFLTAVTLMNDIDMASMNLPVEPLYGEVRLLVCTPVTTVRDDTDGILLKMTSVVNQHGCSSDRTHLSERIHLRFFHKHVS